MKKVNKMRNIISGDEIEGFAIRFAFFYQTERN